MGNGKQDDLTKQALIDKLRAIIDSEMQKPCEKIDDSLVAECADFLMELEEKEMLSDAEVERSVALIFSAGKKAKRKRRSIRALIVAACLAALLLAAGVVAAALGYDAISVLKQFGSSIVEMAVGERRQVGDISIEKGGGAKEYSSIDEFIAGAKLHLLCPSVLPGNTEVECVCYTDSASPKTVYMKSNDASVFIEIQLASAVSDEIIANAVKTETINNFECYFACVDSAGQCAFEFNGNIYTVNAASYDDVVLIINNLKES